jgi:hypothetical protein
MKHIKLFEDFLAEAAIPAPLKKLGKWTSIEANEDLLDGTDYTKVSSFLLDTNTDLDDYGIIVNIYDDKDFSIFFDSTPIALTAHTAGQARSMSQAMDEYPLPLSKLNRAELDKIINDLKSDYLSEAVSPKIGAKTNKFNSIIDEWDWFTDADSTDESLPKEYHTGLKKLGVKANDAIVVFSSAVGSWSDILSAAKKAQIKYVEVDDEETGESAIIFDGTK